MFSKIKRYLGRFLACGVLFLFLLHSENESLKQRLEAMKESTKRSADSEDPYTKLDTSTQSTTDSEDLYPKLGAITKRNTDF